MRNHKTRRDFLKTAGAAAVAVGCAGPVAAFLERDPEVQPRLDHCRLEPDSFAELLHRLRMQSLPAKLNSQADPGFGILRSQPDRFREVSASIL